MLKTAEEIQEAILTVAAIEKIDLETDIAEEYLVMFIGIAVISNFKDEAIFTEFVARGLRQGLQFPPDKAATA